MAHNTFVSKVNNKDCLINSQRILNWIFFVEAHQTTAMEIIR